MDELYYPLHHLEQIGRRVAKAMVVAFPGGERATLAVLDLDLIEAGIVVVTTKIKITAVVVVELARQFESLFWGFGFEVTVGIIGGDEKFGSVGSSLVPCLQRGV